MTTLELAEQITRAVLKGIDCDEIALAPHDEYFDGSTDTPAQSVLNVLHETGHWFCSVQETPQETVLDQLPQLPFDS